MEKYGYKFSFGPWNIHEGADLDGSQARDTLRGRLEAADHLHRAASAFLVALGPGPRLFVPTADPAHRARLLGRATERILADLDDSSPETLRMRLKALIRQVTVQADGTVVDGENIFTEISNTRWTSNFLMAPGASIEDGLLDVTMLGYNYRMTDIQAGHQRR